MACSEYHMNGFKGGMIGMEVEVLVGLAFLCIRYLRTLKYQTITHSINRSKYAVRIIVLADI
jgi:hypothetical protein